MNNDFQVISEDEYIRLTQDGQCESVDELPEVMGRRAWKMAVAGKSRDQIMTKLKMSQEALDEVLNGYRMKFAVSLDTYRALDNERIDRLIGYWMPIARGRNNGNYNLGLKASCFVLQAIERRKSLVEAQQTLTSYSPSQEGTPGVDRPYNERNVVIWLREVLPSIERVTRELEPPAPNGDHPNGQSNGS